MDSKRLGAFLERARSRIFQIRCVAAIAAVHCVRLAGQSRSHGASGTPSASSQAAAPSRALAGEQRGVAVAHESKCKQAVAHYRAAAALEPHLPGMYLDLGLAYFKTGRLGDAVTALEQSVKADPGFQARTFLEMSYCSTRRFADATPQLQIASREQPGNFELCYLRVRSYMRSRQYPSAIEEGQFLDAAGQSHAELKIEPDDNQSLTYQGDAELQLRRRPQAEAHLREALRLDPNSHLTQLDLRILFTDESKPSRSSPRCVVAAAERRIREAVRLDPSPILMAIIIWAGCCFE